MLFLWVFKRVSNSSELHENTDDGGETFFYDEKKHN
jgi:hypothetical protein